MAWALNYDILNVLKEYIFQFDFIVPNFLLQIVCLFQCGLKVEKYLLITLFTQHGSS